MNWTTAAELKAQVDKLWDRGELPASLVNGTQLFPHRLTLRAPTSAELSERFEEVRDWAVALRQTRHCRIVLREVRHRIIGINSVPCEAWVDSMEDALAFIGRRKDAQLLEELAGVTSARNAVLIPWVERYPLRAMALTNEWLRLLDVIGWMQKHPRPGIYLRQIDLPDVHSKFIEAHRGVLSELLDLALPTEVIDSKSTGTSGFCARYGFRDKPQRVRFRMLDPRLALLPTYAEQDITLNSNAFAGLSCGVKRVFITENETNFLAFPKAPDAMVLFGGGYGFEMLAEVGWLSGCDIQYWGDIDTHGFAILDQLRARLPHVQSLLMDRKTLIAHQTLWTREPSPERRDLPRLTSDEKDLFDDLRDNKLGKEVRLEQERIAFGWLPSELSRLK